MQKPNETPYIAQRRRFLRDSCNCLRYANDIVLFETKGSIFYEFSIFGGVGFFITRRDFVAFGVSI